MSRQNKNKKVIVTRQQVTALHKKGVAETGFKRTSLNAKTHSKYSIAFTKKLTNSNKGVCKIIKDPVKGRLRVSASTSNKVNAE
jgi:hypothetical protein